MKNLLKWQLPLLVICSFLVFSCSQDEANDEYVETSKVLKRSSGCDRSISFTKKVTTYVKFDVPDSELLLGEKSLILPKSDVKNYTFCEGSDGVISTTVIKNPNLRRNSDYKSTTLGAPRKISWRSETIGNQTKVYDQEGELISSSSSDSYFTNFDDILQTYESSLVSEKVYESFIRSMQTSLNLEDANDDIIVVITDNGSGVTKTYFDKRCQKEIAVETYNMANKLINRNSYLYTVDGTQVNLSTQMSKSFKKSPDSDKTMSLISVSNYSYN